MTVTDIEGLYTKQTVDLLQNNLINLLRWKQEYSRFNYTIFSAFEQKEKVFDIKL